MIGIEGCGGEQVGPDGCVVLAADLCGAYVGDALGVLEADYEAVEAAPEVNVRLA